MKLIKVDKVAEVKLIYRTKVKPSDRIQVKQSIDSYNIFMDRWNLDTLEYIEEFKILLLNRSNKVLGITTVSSGGTAGTVTDVRMILQYALKANAMGIIICHNHPSGCLNPSESDKKITQKIKEAAAIMDMQLLDHLIIIPGEITYYSFADDGLM
jgi:DNA repair protein RadC